MAQPRLLEREEPFAAIAGALERAADGMGAFIVLEGPAGIGKTALVDAATDLGRSRGFTVLKAAGLELERPFAWGVARQLFERWLAGLDPAVREAVLAGAALPAEALLGQAPTAAVDPFGALHALYWLTANAAEAMPLLLVVDDAHWVDEPTQRLLAYLAPRIGELRAALIVATRPPDRGSAVLRALVRDRAAKRFALGPLSEAAVAELLGSALGTAPAPAFAGACHAACGGNPFLVATAAEALAARGVAPTADAAEQARELGTRAMSEAVVERMLRLPDDAQRLAHAVAVLGTDAQLRDAAEIAGMDSATAAAAADALAAAHVIRHERPLSFAHPLLQSAIAGAMPAWEREGLHARAAERLEREGAPADRVAGHWLLAAPGGGEPALRALRAAAASAIERGAPDTALPYLRRALEEPQTATARADLLGELGAVELRLGLELGERHVRQALELTADGHRHAELTRALRLPLFAAGRHAEAAELFSAALARLGDGDRELALKLRTDVLTALLMSAGHGGEVGGGLELAGTTPGERALLAAAAFALTMNGGTAEEVSAVASRAAGGRALAEDGDALLPLVLLVDALLATERHQDAEALNQAAVEHARRRGGRVATATLSWSGAMIAAARGALPDAVAHGEAAVAEARELRLQALRAWATASLAGAHLDRGHVDAARATLEAEDSVPGGLPGHSLAIARARLRLAEGDLPGAGAEFEAGLAADGWGARNPAFYPLRTLLARARLALGDRAGAEAAAEEEVALARRWGAPTAIGRALTTLGLCRPGDDGIALLTEAAELLADSPALLERARAQVELGAAIRRAGRRTEAQEPLRLGLDLAVRCGADALAEHARDELRAAGARPRRSALGGIEALTPSELRVVRLAADGLTNREIAQALFVTRSTVEVHLTHAYQKLSISSRAELRELID